MKQVLAAILDLDVIEKYEQEFYKHPQFFKLRCNISGEVLEINLNKDIIKGIKKFFKKEKIKNQKILNNNPEEFYNINLKL